MAEQVLPNHFKTPAKRIGWKSPANIALIKYWGKQPVQQPMNPSLSFVLNNSTVSMFVDFEDNSSNKPMLEVFSVNGQPNEPFRQRFSSYLQSIVPIMPFLRNISLRIESHSSFPHSAGIASSAAAFSALALCLCSMEEAILVKKMMPEDFLRKASNLSRLGSGSACRSLYPGMVMWGESSKIPDSSNDYALPLDNQRVHPSYLTLKDAILIASDQQKAVSSSQGHELMNNHPYRESRKAQAAANLGKLMIALAGGNHKTFFEVVEEEALTLHGLMMSSSPGYVLMKPNTLRILDEIRTFRNQSGLHLGFTMDAGPNVHLLYFESDRQTVKSFIESRIQPLCQEGRWIDDAMGTGPSILTQKP